jgi:hypothetical protein
VQKYKLKKKNIFEMCPGDVWVETYLEEDVARMFIGILDEPSTEMLWDDLIEIHFEERFNWVVSIFLGKFDLLQGNIVEIDSYPEHRSFYVVDDMEKSSE